MSGVEMTFGPDPTKVRKDLHKAVISMPIATVAKITGRSTKAVEKWRAHVNVPSLMAVFALARVNQDVWDLVREQCGRANDIGDAEAMLKRMRELLEERTR
jgi:hypothetical protein